ncbi:MAG: GNAT family N-acetyltransferase [Rhodobacteraceae bacterium]|nr:MAG: GNAT family N-acetyltransferase [Paracoccaceae bacterium]
MSNVSKITVSAINSLSDISQKDWDICAVQGSRRARDPFTTYRFLKALEDSGSVGAGSGWGPHYLIARQGDQVIAVMPLYAKSHSQGEYIFDHNWAQAYESSGGDYYPKLQAAVPFTPVTGRRFLCRAGFDATGRAALVKGLMQMTADNGLSSIHITFCDADEYAAGTQMGLLPRLGQQFHWLNDNYQTFDDFLGALSSRKRKNIRKERIGAQGFGGRIVQLTGDDLKAEHFDAFWQFYQDTGARKWGTPYLTRAFFDIALETLRDDILLIMCELDGRWVAGALNIIGDDCLYGRYWGASQHLPFMHFEVCYYQAIDYAIKHGLARVEAGAQGEHKLARGYLPKPTYSLHWINDAGFRDAVAHYLDAERDAIDEEIEVLTDYGPFKKYQGEDDG